MDFTRPHSVRFVALIVAGMLVAPAIMECAGWASSVVGRHICCTNRGEMASETTMTDCCGMSQQSNDAIPPETQSGRPSLKLFDPASTHFADLYSSWRSPLLNESSAQHRAAYVPLYLQQASLLI